MLGVGVAVWRRPGDQGGRRQLAGVGEAATSRSGSTSPGSATAASPSASQQGGRRAGGSIIGGALALIMGWFAFDTSRPCLWLGVGLLTGGAIGNLIDRLANGVGHRLSQPAAVARLQSRRRRDHGRGDGRRARGVRTTPMPPRRLTNRRAREGVTVARIVFSDDHLAVSTSRRAWSSIRRLAITVRRWSRPRCSCWAAGSASGPGSSTASTATPPA